MILTIFVFPFFLSLERAPVDLDLQDSEKRSPDSQHDYDFYYAGGPAVDSEKRSPEAQHDYDFYYAGGPAVDSETK